MNNCPKCRTTYHFSGKCQPCRQASGIQNNGKNFRPKVKTIIYDELGYARKIRIGARTNKNKIEKEVISG